MLQVPAEERFLKALMILVRFQIIEIHQAAECEADMGIPPEKLEHRLGFHLIAGSGKTMDFGKPIFLVEESFRDHLPGVAHRAEKNGGGGHGVMFRAK
jgi:hypothetical protein